MAGSELSFAHLGLDSRILQAICDLGWLQPTLIQAQAIPLALEGKDLLARAKTGSGKTGAYAVPLLQHVLRAKASPAVAEQAVRGLILVPTKELGQQVLQMVRQLAAYCSRDLRVVDISGQADLAAQRPILMEKPDVVVGTPSRVLAHLQAETLSLRDSLQVLVMDEADLLFSFGFEEDLKSLLCHLPKIYQSFLMSATFNEDVQALKELVLHNPVTLKLQESQLPDSSQLSQFQIRCETQEDKFLLLYALLKLSLVRGKVLLFVSSIGRCYRLKLFLEQFSIPACVLNSELPVQSRCHIISQFNRGFYSYIIATDEHDLAEPQGSQEGRKRRRKGAKAEKGKDQEYGVSRGIDFQNVSAVINFDLPPSVESYVHRAGRTARADNPGTALTFVLHSESDLLATIEAALTGDSNESPLRPYQFRMEEIEGLRYRCQDAMRSVTKQAIKEARLREIKEELLNSEKLKTYFEDNPRDLDLLRHDQPLHPAIVKPHLRNVPEYLVPPTLRAVAQPLVGKCKRRKPPLSTKTAAPTEIHRAGYCSFYGECGQNPEVGASLLRSSVPCLSNTPARRVSGTHLDLLKSVCPTLFTGDNATYACCNANQLRAMRTSLLLSQGVLSRCPSCSENFANIYCQNVCSPDQSLFTNVTRFFNRTTILGIRQVGVVEYQCYYSRRFADQSYDSCKGVRLPATGGYAISAMCGKYGATLCNSQRWLDFQGDPSNGLAPLRISFQLMPEGSAVGDGIVPLNGTAWRCSEAVRGSGEKCSCPDCAESCPPIPAPPPASQAFKVGRMSGLFFVCLLLFGFLVLLFVTFLVWRSCSSSSSAKQKDQGAQQGPGARLTCSGKASQAIHSFLARAFSSWGTLVASYPITVIVISGVLVAALSSGLVFIRLTTDPVELWSSPHSRARQEKAFYDQHFGPFFRTNQVILTAKNRPGYSYDSLILGKKNFSGILSLEVLLQVLELQTRLQDIEVWSEKHSQNVSLKDVCYAPLNPSNATLSDCCVNSLLQYFQNNRTRLQMTANQTLRGETGTVDWRDHFLYCINSPLSFQDITALELSCMAEYGAPVFPFLAVGGYQGEEYSESQALILTVSLNNFPSSDPRFDFVRLWEEQFLKILQEFQQENTDKYTVAYMAERSLEDEINRTTWEDLPIFALSYLVIFVYITLALGEYSSCRRIPVDSKLTLGLGGILVVLGAVLASLGFYAFVGLPSSLIIIEVVPFLVLAVGADNIFIFVLEYQQTQQLPGESPEQRIGRVLGSVAPSMVLCSLSETICFFLGALTEMPAVRTFALNAALAVLLDFLLQISLFVALMSLDARRQQASRCDLCCCLRLEKTESPVEQQGGLLRSFVRRFYAPVLLNCVTRVLVMLLFLLMFCAGIFLLFNVQVGLEQELSVPEDSYMLQYFQDLNRYFMVGVPTYFVTTGGYNFSTVPGMNGVCSSVGCDNNSLTQKIQYATQFPNESFLAIPASSWVDDFIDWLNPFSGCCRVHSFGAHKGEFCPSTDNSLSCLLSYCMGHQSGTFRPDVEQFNSFLPWFLHDVPNLKCPKGGLGAYDTSVRIGPDGQILASRFMAYHTPLKNSQEYTEALRAARKLADSITASMREVPGTDPSFQVFPYTITYAFYEQYLTISLAGIVILALCLMPTFLVCYVLLGMDVRSGAINLVTIIMILVDTVGAMTLWGIPYNAISLINLVTAVGISVEFVSHITLSFAVSTKPSRLERAREATIHMGSAVFAGVAMTNLPGIVVLAFAKAQLIQIFFFRLNLIITLLGMLHGLVFLPVVLSYFGPEINWAWEQAQQRNRKEKRLAAAAAAAAHTSACGGKEIQHPDQTSPSDGDPPVWASEGNPAEPGDPGRENGQIWTVTAEKATPL